MTTIMLLLRNIIIRDGINLDEEKVKVTKD